TLLFRAYARSWHASIGVATASEPGPTASERTTTVPSRSVVTLAPRSPPDAASAVAPTPLPGGGTTNANPPTTIASPGRGPWTDRGAGATMGCAATSTATSAVIALTGISPCERPCTRPGRRPPTPP